MFSCRDEWDGCQRLFKEKGMCTFADWLRYYNNLDVAPGLEALEKMRAFYTDKGIDILKDAVSIPGVSLHYLLRGCVERGADLYSPCKEAYEMMKEAVVGGPSLVFTRYHEVGVTKIKSHRIAEPRLCKNINSGLRRQCFVFVNHAQRHALWKRKGLVNKPAKELASSTSFEPHLPRLSLPGLIFELLQTLSNTLAGCNKVLTIY